MIVTQNIYQKMMLRVWSVKVRFTLQIAAYVIKTSNLLWKRNLMKNIVLWKYKCNLVSLWWIPFNSRNDWCLILAYSKFWSEDSPAMLVPGVCGRDSAQESLVRGVPPGTLVLVSFFAAICWCHYAEAVWAPFGQCRRARPWSGITAMDHVFNACAEGARRAQTRRAFRSRPG